MIEDQILYEACIYLFVKEKRGIYRASDNYLNT